MKSAAVFLLSALLFLSVFLFRSAFAQPAEVSYTVNLNSFSLQVTYPSEVMPGNVITVSVQGSPRVSGVYLQNLNVTIYYADARGLHQVAFQTLVSNPVSYGYYGASTTGSFSTNFTVSVPQDVPRTSLVAIFSETTQSNVYYNYYNYYNGPYPFSFWYYRNPLFYSYYPSYSTTTDDAISPLSYVNATTPEYLALQSEYRTLQQQLNQTQGQNEKLQRTITQQNATISQLNQELTSAGTTMETYQAVAGVFIIIAVALAVLAIYQIRRKEKAKNTIESGKPETT